MTIFNLPESDVLGLLARVRGMSDDTGIDPAEAFARAAWTCIAEPGDGVAGLVVNTLGAAAALRLVLTTAQPERWEAALMEQGEAVDPEGEALRVESIAGGIERWRPRLNSVDVVRACEQARRVSAQLVVPGDALWPVQVADLGQHAPIALWWRGIPNALRALDNSIALVGARASSGYGEHVAMEAASGLVDRGYAIVSGAAYGIDGMAHRSALASRGLTVAFLAGGLDRFYPRGHDDLLTKIAQSGCIVSELPCGQEPTKWRFLQRNRLIAASSNATVVIEAGWRSGSLNTASHAAEMGRPLGAVPGPVTSPSSAGCHRLLREYDAVCVTNAAEMAALVDDDGGSGDGQAGAGTNVADRSGEYTSDETRLIDALSTRSPRYSIDVARRSGLSVTTVTSTLAFLELAGAVAERENGWVLAPKARKGDARARQK